MPDVSFTIAQRTYTLRCAPGQETRLREAASKLGERVARLPSRAGGGDDRQLLVIAALELIDALDESRKAAESAAAEAASARAEAESAKAEAAALRAWAGRLADRLDALAGGSKDA